MEKVYWTMRNGQKIDVDTMDINHLKNTLKMLIKAIRVKSTPKPKFEVDGEIASEFADMAELYAINPELTCTCDEVHTCQQCFKNL
jgi:ribosome-binding factor A